MLDSRLTSGGWGWGGGEASSFQSVRAGRRNADCSRSGRGRECECRSERFKRKAVEGNNKTDDDANQKEKLWFETTRNAPACES